MTEETQEFDLTPAQAGITDENNLKVLRPTVDGKVLAIAADGVLVEIAPDGESTTGQFEKAEEYPGVTEEVEPPPAPPAPEEVMGGGTPLDAFTPEVPISLEKPGQEPDPEDYKPPEVALAVDDRSEADVYRAMDRADELLILDELQGRVIKTMVYSYESKGELITDLSVYGVNETVRLMNERGGCQIGVSPVPEPIVTEVREGEEDYYQVMVFARDARFPETGRWGSATEPKVMTLKNGNKVWDKFALTKALNKAERNALKKQIPEDWRQFIIAQATQQDRVEYLRPLGSGVVAELPPAIQSEEAELIRRQIHEVYAELKELNRLAMPPGRFNGWLTRVETESEERMEAFRDQLIDLVAGEKERLAAQAEAKS